MKTLAAFFLIVTIIDFLYQKLFFQETEEEVTDSSIDVLEEDKEKINLYLKAKKYRLMLSTSVDAKEVLSLKEKRTYHIRFKNEHNKTGKASIVINPNGNIELFNLKILEDYYTKRRRHFREKTYHELLDENIRYKTKVKEVQKTLKELLKNK